MKILSKINEVVIVNLKQYIYSKLDQLNIRDINF